MDKHEIIKAGTVLIFNETDVDGKIRKQTLTIATADPWLWHPGNGTNKPIYACNIQGMAADILLDFLEPITDAVLTPDVKKLIRDHLNTQVEAFAANLSPKARRDLLLHLQYDMEVQNAMRGLKEQYINEVI